MKKGFNGLNLVDHFLKSSPRNEASKINRIFVHSQIRLTKLPSDDKYLNDFM